MTFAISSKKGFKDFFVKLFLVVALAAVVGGANLCAQQVGDPVPNPAEAAQAKADKASSDAAEAKATADAAATQGNHGDHFVLWLAFAVLALAVLVIGFSRRTPREPKPDTDTPKKPGSTYGPLNPPADPKTDPPTRPRPILPEPKVLTIRITDKPGLNIMESGTTWQFKAFVETTGGASNEALWTASGGTMTPDGKFTAPTVKKGKVEKVTVTVISVFDPTKSAVVTLDIEAEKPPKPAKPAPTPPAPAPLVPPPPAAPAAPLAPTQTGQQESSVKLTKYPTQPLLGEKQFQFMVKANSTDGADAPVIWKIQKGGGTIDEQGLYTAPNVREEMIVEVVVFLKGNPEKLDSCTFRVWPAPIPPTALPAAIAIFVLAIAGSTYAGASPCFNAQHREDAIPYAAKGRMNSIVCRSSSTSITVVDSAGNNVSLSGVTQVDRNTIRFDVTPSKDDYLRVMSGPVTIDTLMVTDMYGAYLVRGAVNISTAKTKEMLAPVAVKAAKASKDAKEAKNAAVSAGANFEKYFGSDGKGGVIGQQVADHERRIATLEGRSGSSPAFGEALVSMANRLQQLEAGGGNSTDIKRQIDELKAQLADVQRKLELISAARVKTGIFHSSTIIEAAEKAQEKTQREAERIEPQSMPVPANLSGPVPPTRQQ